MDLPESILSMLPRESRDKLDRLMSERQAAIDTYRAASDREQEARQALGLADGMARQQLEIPAGISFDTHPAAAVVEARHGLTKSGQAEREARENRLLAPVEAARRRLQLALDARDRAAERQSSFAFLENVEQWLSRAAAFGGMRLQHHAPAAPKVRDPMAEVAKIRAELAGLDAAWTAAENAPCPADELRARFLSELDAIAERGRPNVDVTARAGSPVNLASKLRLRQEPVRLPDMSDPYLTLSGDAGASFFAWLFRDQIAERITALIDAAAPAEGALTDNQRDAEFSRISAKRLELERAEEALIVAMEAEGRTIQRRRDADPRAILELREV